MAEASGDESGHSCDRLENDESPLNGLDGGVHGFVTSHKVEGVVGSVHLWHRQKVSRRR
jgi:hypothetical protein